MKKEENILRSGVVISFDSDVINMPENSLVG
jgi:hypothetical protein